MLVGCVLQLDGVVVLDRHVGNKRRLKFVLGVPTHASHHKSAGFLEEGGFKSLVVVDVSTKDEFGNAFGLGASLQEEVVHSFGAGMGANRDRVDGVVHGNNKRFPGRCVA